MQKFLPLVLVSFVAAFVVGFACEAPPPELLDGRVEIPPVPEVGSQFQSPDIVIPAGEDKMICWVPDAEFTETVMVRQFIGVQNGMGHHLAAFISQVPRQPGDVFDCTQLESMTTIEPFLVPANAPGTLDPIPDLALFPEGFAVRVEPGTKLVFQSHYINVSDQDMVISDVANLHYVPVGEEADFTEVGYWTLNHGFIDVPVGEDGTFTTSCEIDREFQMLSLLGHMHDWGTGMKIELERDGVRESIYDVPDWTAEFRDLPPMENYAPAEPLRFLPGDRVHVSCDFHNDTDRPLRFPEEMCVAFGAYFGDVTQGFFICNN